MRHIAWPENAVARIQSKHVLSHLKNELPLPDKEPLVLCVVIVQRWAAFRRSEGVVNAQVTAAVFCG